jgi:hypothetical protein
MPLLGNVLNLMNWTLPNLANIHIEWDLTQTHCLPVDIPTGRTIGIFFTPVQTFTGRKLGTKINHPFSFGKLGLQAPILLISFHECGLYIN